MLPHVGQRRRTAFLVYVIVWCRNFTGEYGLGMNDDRRNDTTFEQLDPKHATDEGKDVAKEKNVAAILQN